MFSKIFYNVCAVIGYVAAKVHVWKYKNKFVKVLTPCLTKEKKNGLLYGILIISIAGGHFL